MAHIAIIDYGAGNLHSVCAGFRRVMRENDTLELKCLLLACVLRRND